MKKVIFGSALLLGGILLTTQSVIGAEMWGDLIRALPFVGIGLFLGGIILGVIGLIEDNK